MEHVAGAPDNGGGGGWGGGGCTLKLKVTIYRTSEVQLRGFKKFLFQ